MIFPKKCVFSQPYKLIIDLMYSKKLKVWMLFVILISGITFVSCSKDDDFINPQAEQGSKYRALLKTLNWGIDTCYVYGHKIPDVDAITSATFIANRQRNLSKFGDLRCFYSVICGIFVRLIVTISFGESWKGISLYFSGKAFCCSFFRC